MGSNILTQYQEDLTFDQAPRIKGKTLWQRQNGKFIYHVQGKWNIVKSIKGKNRYFGRFEKFNDAMNIRDQLIENDWDKSKIEYPEEYVERWEQFEYYKNIQTHSRRYYSIRSPVDDYCGSLHNIEEALQYRDLLYEAYNNGVDVRGCRPSDFDLKTDNPYLRDGLKYPIPERLLLEKPETDYGKGQIRKKGPQSYHIYYGSKGNGKTDYICACRTYEQAYYVRQEMNKVDWDMSKLEEILDNYPVWYTKLLQLYKWITPYETKKGKLWKVTITPKYSDTGKLEYLSCFSRLEDALFERDLLLKYGFNEELMCECADYSENPYYSIELPPYPERKLPNMREREDRTELFNDLRGILLEDPHINQSEWCECAAINETGLRILLKKEFNLSLQEFKELILSGEDPNEVLEQKPLIYTPDLEIHTGASYIAYYPDRRSPYVITKWFDGKNHYYGEYPTRELAEKIVKDLKRCNWDKNELARIQAKHGHQSMMMSKRWVYANKRTSKRTGKTKIYSYSVRHKDKDKRMIQYGTYKDKRVAELVRDLLILYDWDKAELCWIQDLATYTIEQADNNWRCRL